MDNLIHACSSALDQADTPVCGTDYGERVIKIAFCKLSDKTAWDALVSASDVPTAAEFEVGVASDYLTILEGITNGHRVEQGATELSGDDTESGGMERYDVQYRVEGRLKRVDEEFKRMTEKLTLHSTLRMWFFTEKNYCFGGVSGYVVSPNFSETIMEGKGQPPYMPFQCDYVATGADYAAYDADYATLDNT